MIVDSKQEKLNMPDVIKNSLENTKSEYPFKVAFLSIIKELTLPGAAALQEGNTLFIIHRTKEKRYGFFRALNCDTAENFIKNGVKFAKDAYSVGFDTVVTQFTDPTILNVFKAISRNPPNKGMGYSVQRTKDDGYQVTLQLGKSRGKK
jgi:hypothetical protein